MHKLLARQVRRFFGAQDAVPPHLAGFLEAVEGAYRAADEDRRMLERSMELVSQELLERYRDLQSEVAERANVEAALHRSEEYFRALIENASDVITVLEADGRVRYHSPAVERLVGVPAEKLVGSPITDGVHPEDQAAVAAFFHRVRGCAGAVDTLSFRNRNRHGGWSVVEATATNLLDAPAVVGIVVNSRDVTARTRSEQALRESEARFRTVVESLGEGLLITDREDRILYANPRVKEIYGWDAAELVGCAALEVLVPQEERELYLERRARRLEGVAERYEMRSLRKDGSGGWTEVHATPFPDADGRIVGTLAAVTEITDRKNAEEQLAHGALHDALTGLPNRALFFDRLEHAIERLRRGRGSAFAVLFLDVDRFKLVNDSLGHGIGDDLLRGIGARLVTSIRPGDTVSRFGGDEFTLLLEGVGSAAEASHIAERVLETLSAPFTLGGHEVFTSASIGIALCAGDTEPEALLRNADAALHRAKLHGKARYELFDLEMHAAAKLRLRMETDLRRSLVQEEIRISYQPLVRLDTGQIAGFEALLRWHHPELGIIYPNSFIPVAEETGFILPLGRWALEEACREAARWRHWAVDGRPMSISVNLSARQLMQSDLVTQIERTLQDAGVCPELLVLEITESVLIEKAERASAMIAALRALGVRLHLDDFGTGYASLAYLQRYAFDVVKIDRTFVSGMDEDLRKAQFVSGIIALAKQLGVQVVAEGVESRAQLAQLREMGCDYAQGYLMSVPVAPDTVEPLVRADPRW